MDQLQQTQLEKFSLLSDQSWHSTSQESQVGIIVEEQINILIKKCLVQPKILREKPLVFKKRTSLFSR